MNIWVGRNNGYHCFQVCSHSPDLLAFPVPEKSTSPHLLKPLKSKVPSIWAMQLKRPWYHGTAPPNTNLGAGAIRSSSVHCEAGTFEKTANIYIYVRINIPALNVFDLPPSQVKHYCRKHVTTINQPFNTLPKSQTWHLATSLKWNLTFGWCLKLPCSTIWTRQIPRVKGHLGSRMFPVVSLYRILNRARVCSQNQRTIRWFFALLRETCLGSRLNCRAMTITHKEATILKTFNHGFEMNPKTSIYIYIWTCETGRPSNPEAPLSTHGIQHSPSYYLDVQ